MSQNESTKFDSSEDDKGTELDAKFIKNGLELLEYAANYHNTIRDLAVKPEPRLQPGYLRDKIPHRANSEPDTFENLMKDFKELVIPGMVHWQSPKFHGFFPTGFSIPCIYAEMMTAVLASQCFTWDACPVYTELATVMMDWLATEINLPTKFHISSGLGGGGLIYTSASEVTLVTVLTARHQVTTQIMGCSGNNVSYHELLSKLVVYGSDQTHCCLARAAKVAGIKLRTIPTGEDLLMQAKSLEDAILEDKSQGLIPIYVLATLGTTDTCAFDDIQKIGEISRKYNLWFHVDAAYAGTMFLCEEYQYLIKDISMARSLVINAHKWMEIPFDCSLMWVDNVIVIKAALISNQSILETDDGSNIMENKDLQISLGSKFTSLKLWFHFRLSGTKAIKEHIRQTLTLCQYMGDLMKADERLDICYPMAAALICFRLRESLNYDSEVCTRELFKIIDREDIYLSTTVVKGRFIIRFSTGCVKCHKGDMDYAWNIIKKSIDSLPIDWNSVQFKNQ